MLSLVSRQAKQNAERKKSGEVICTPGDPCADWSPLFSPFHQRKKVDISPLLSFQGVLESLKVPNETLQTPRRTAQKVRLPLRRHQPTILIRPAEIAKKRKHDPEKELLRRSKRHRRGKS